MLKQLLRGAIGVVLLAAICASLPAAQAAPGDLDPTFAGFGAGGDVTFKELRPDGMVLRPDGRILMVVNWLTNDVKVRELKPDGKFYGEYVIPNPFQIKFFAKDIALQADGKIVVAGYAVHAIAKHSMMLARLDGNGQLDPSFGEGGYVVTDFGQNQEEAAFKVLIQPDGKIVVVGYAYVSGDNDFAVVRYTPAGKPDATFGGGDGIVTIDLGDDDRAYDMALQSDGKLVVVGDTLQGNGNTYDFGLVRLEADGSLDDNSNGDGGFRGNGKFNQDFDSKEFVDAVAIQPDGKIVVAGHDAFANRGIVARFLPNGAREISGFNNYYFAPVGSELKDLALQPDGKILITGSLNGDAAFFRLNPTGTPDTSFNNSGIKTINFGGPDRSETLALLPDGRILGLGISNTSTIQGFLVRLWPDGTWDSGGKQTHGISPGSYELAYALTVQPDGKLLVAGELSAPNNTSSNAFVTRFHPDGRVDTGFGPSGQGTIHPAYIFSQPTFRGARALAVQPDGKIVMAGYSDVGSGSNADFLVARWHSNGAPDFNFGLSGFRPVGFPGNGDDYGTALALAPGGKIVVAGNVWNGSRQVWGVARLTSTGQPDPTFDSDGLFSFGLDVSNAVNAVAVQPDGKILVAGHIGGDFAVARLAENGSLDASFGQGGFAINDLGGTNVVNALALAANGWIYAVGSRLQNGNEDMALAQFTPEGALASCPDPANCHNWPSGTFFMNWGISDTAYALDLRSDNQLVAAGCADQLFAAVQVRTDGPPTPLLFNADFTGHQDCARAVKFSGANRIVLAGAQNLYPIARDWNIALARFETTVNNTVPPPPPTPPPGSNVYPVYLPIIVR